jgi:predicted nucleic acid-binding protein
VLTAVDTNVISALWSKEPAATGMKELLFAARQEGGLVVCAPVYAELLAYPGATKQFVDAFLGDTDIDVRADLSLEVWARAGEAFSAYAERRRKDRAGQPKRLLVDFVVGAHALLMTDRLLTLDANRYCTAYPELRLTPESGLPKG